MTGGVFTTVTPHGYLTGQRVVFARLTGGTGIVPQSSVSLGVVYYIYRIDGVTFKICDTQAHALAGTGFITPSDAMTAGQIIAAEFALGAPHPQFPYLYLMEITTRNAHTSWNRALALYRGLEEFKPFKRMITCNGVQMSSSQPIVWDFPDGWETPLSSSVMMPEIVVTDIYLQTSGLLTELVPSSTSSVGEPANAPAIASVFIYGTDDTVEHRWPNGWSLLDESHVDTLNIEIPTILKRRVWQYRWAIGLK